MLYLLLTPLLPSASAGSAATAVHSSSGDHRDVGSPLTFCLSGRDHHNSKSEPIYFRASSEMAALKYVKSLLIQTIQNWIDGLNGGNQYSGVICDQLPFPK